MVMGLFDRLAGLLRGGDPVPAAPADVEVGVADWDADNVPTASAPEDDDPDGVDA